MDLGPCEREESRRGQNEKRQREPTMNQHDCGVMEEEASPVRPARIIEESTSMTEATCRQSSRRKALIRAKSTPSRDRAVVEKDDGWSGDCLLGDVASVQSLLSGSGCGENNDCGKHRKCRVCARFFYRPRYMMQSCVFHSLEILDIDFGMFELVRRIDETRDYRVDREIAIKTAELTLKHAHTMRKKLTQVGLLKGPTQNYVGDTSHARVIAPFDRSEIRFGRMLGCGGFSSVYEIECFEPDQVLSTGVTRQEHSARQFMADHAIMQMDTALSAKSNRRPNQAGRQPLSRYAAKHLKHALARHPEQFQRAALDLVLEGQLLLALDHPNIISVRGWSYYGPDTYRSGKYNDYFLILDRLPETLDHRIEEWRNQYRRYRRRLTFQRAKYTAKFRRLFQERLQVALDICSALQYLHDRRIINRDIKSSNIGFDVNGEVKVFDFGLSRLLPEEEEVVEDGRYAMSRVGTKLYMAPEVREKRPYSLSADVYSFGIVLWEILSLSTPKKPSNESTMKCWLPICPCWPAELQNLIVSCLSSDPAQRPTMTQIYMSLKRHTRKEGPRYSERSQRRRSTFRVDLSDLTKIEGKDDAVLEHGSAESKTSRTSMSEECILLSSPE